MDPIGDEKKSILSNLAQTGRLSHVSELQTALPRIFYLFYLVSVHKWLFSPISLSDSKNCPRNINYMPADIFFVLLDLGKNILFLDRHYLISVSRQFGLGRQTDVQEVIIRVTAFAAVIRRVPRPFFLGGDVAAKHDCRCRPRHEPLEKGTLLFPQLPDGCCGKITAFQGIDDLKNVIGDIHHVSCRAWG